MFHAEVHCDAPAEGEPNDVCRADPEILREFVEVLMVMERLPRVGGPGTSKPSHVMSNDSIRPGEWFDLIDVDGDRPEQDELGRIWAATSGGIANASQAQLAW